MREFSVRPKPSNRKANLFFTLLSGAAFAVVLASMLIDNYRGIVCLLGVGLLVGALTLYTKYLSVQFSYDLTFDSEGRPLFVVRQFIGKRETTLCRIALSEIRKVECESAEQTKSHKTPKGYLKYAYLPTLMPDKVYRITSVSRYEKSEILIEVSDEFACELRNLAREAAELSTEFDDE